MEVWRIKTIMNVGKKVALLTSFTPLLFYLFTFKRLFTIKRLLLFKIIEL